MNKLIYIVTTSVGLLGSIIYTNWQRYVRFMLNRRQTKHQMHQARRGIPANLQAMIEQLTKIIGNNTSTLKNNTNIGNPNSNTMQGMSKEGNTTMSQNK